MKVVGKENAEIAVLLECFSNFWKTLEMSLINCKFNLIFRWLPTCAISETNRAITFAITGTKRYTPILTLSTKDNAKLLQQWKSGFKRTINWNKYYSEISIERRNLYLDFLTDPRFQGVNTLIVLSFENNTNRRRYIGYFLPKVQIKVYSAMIDGQSFVNQPIKDDVRTYDNIWIIRTTQRDG